MTIPASDAAAERRATEIMAEVDRMEQSRRERAAARVLRPGRRKPRRRTIRQLWRDLFTEDINGPGSEGER